MLFSLRPLLVAALLLPFANPLSGQKLVPKKILFSGTTADQAELLAVSGLKPGTGVDQPAIQAAAQKLIDTGLFSDVRFAFDGVDLTFALKPSAPPEPVHYANFPWWDDQALNTALAARVPLFHGSVPPESGMQQQVAEALTAMLAEKGVQASVSAVPAKDEAGRDAGIAFHLDSPPVQVGAVSFSGASAAWTEPVAAIGKAASGQDFDGATGAALTAALRAIYHRQGYLEAAMSGFSHGQPQISNGKVLVPVSATIVEGAQYRVAGLHLSDNALMSPDEFAREAKIHPGDVANEDLLRATLERVSIPYKAHGYLRVKIDAVPKLDSMQHTVDYSIMVQSGPVFHMGQLSLLNLSAEQQGEVLQVWPLHQGDVYDASMVQNFLNRYRAKLHSLDGWSASYKAYENEQTHIVDLVVAFQKGGQLR